MVKQKSFDFLTEIKWITPPEEGGQIVQTSYGWHKGDLYEMIEDHSDRSVVYFKVKVPKSKKELPDDFWNGTPCWVMRAKRKKIINILY